MSGLAAIFNRDGAAVDREHLIAMLAASPHRSLDGQHHWLDGPVALAHQHFWVTPEEVGEQQPLRHATGLVLAFDGRLDNRDELLARLGITHDRSQPVSDATLALEAYCRWGCGCFGSLLGDFALVIWDPAARCLVLARDALGTRGLYYYLDGRCCLVASEIKQLLAHPAVPRRLDNTAVGCFLSGWWYDPEQTLYRRIRQCPPAHWLAITADKVRRDRYWRLRPGPAPRYPGDEAYVEHFGELLLEATRCRLRTRGPVAISLSGGLDSSSVAALAAQHLPRPQPRLRSFSYVFDELSSCDERPYIQPLVARYGLLAQYIPADELWTLRDLQQWPGTADWPVSDAYVWLPLSVMQAASQTGCRVLLNGHFGDALLGRNSAADGTGRPRGSLAGLLQSTGTWWLRLRRLGLAGFHLLVSPLHPGLTPKLARKVRLRHQPAQTRQHLRRKVIGRGLALPDLTRGGWSQGASVLHEFHNRYGLEPAAPFWDRRLVEFVLRLPDHLLRRPGCSKWILRQAMRRHLPTMVRERADKTSFYPLFLRGMSREAATVRRLLTNSQIVKRELVREEWLRAELEAAPRWTRQGYDLWLALSLELWLQRYWT